METSMKANILKPNKILILISFFVSTYCFNQAFAAFLELDGKDPLKKKFDEEKGKLSSESEPELNTDDYLTKKKGYYQAIYDLRRSLKAASCTDKDNEASDICKTEEKDLVKQWKKEECILRLNHVWYQHDEIKTSVDLQSKKSPNPLYDDKYFSEKFKVDDEGTNNCDAMVAYEKSRTEISTCKWANNLPRKKVFLGGSCKKIPKRNANDANEPQNYEATVQCAGYVVCERKADETSKVKYVKMVNCGLKHCQKDEESAQECMKEKNYAIKDPGAEQSSDVASEKLKEFLQKEQD